MRLHTLHLLRLIVHWEGLSVILAIDAQRRIDEPSSKIIMVLRWRDN